METITYTETPKLHEPCLIVGFEGWPNAAEISSTCLQYLIETSQAVRFASISMEDFYQISSSRPVAVIKEGRLMDLKSPGNTFYYWRGFPSGDFIFFSGIEPHFRWEAFADLFLDVAEKFSVTQVITVGGTYDYIPHTYPPTVSALFNDDSLRQRILEAGFVLTEYTGPISIHTFLLEAARKRRVKALGLWGHAPQYLQTKNVRVALSVLKGLAKLTDLDLDFSELEQTSDYFDQQVNELVSQDPKLQEVISKLEEVYKRSGRVPPAAEKQRKHKEDKVITIQAFLKKREDEDKKEG